MPYVNKPRPYKHEYQLQLERGPKEHENRMERQRARREYDKKGIDRTGKDIDHVVKLSKGGSNKTGTRLVSVHKNRSRNQYKK